MPTTKNNEEEKTANSDKSLENNLIDLLVELMMNNSSSSSTENGDKKGNSSPPDAGVKSSQKKKAKADQKPGKSDTEINKKAIKEEPIEVESYRKRAPLFSESDQDTETYQPKVRNSQKSSKSPKNTPKKTQLNAQNTLVEISQDGVKLIPNDQDNQEETKLKDINDFVEVEPSVKPSAREKLGTVRQKKEAAKVTEEKPQEAQLDDGSIELLFQLFNSPSIANNQADKAAEKTELNSSITKADSQEITTEKSAENDQDQSKEGDSFSLLQNILVGPELAKFRQLNSKLENQLAKLENQLYNPEELIALILPLMTDLLQLKVAESSAEVAKAIAPIIDEAIARKILSDKQAVIDAIGPILPEAIAQQIMNHPEEFAKAIAPDISAAIREQINLDEDSMAIVLGPQMGKAIKEQIVQERDAMVDALYPVIGNTIAKYMSEAINNINEKISNTLSIEGVSRRIKSKIQGVSEAELILRESVPFDIEAIFLIHKTSGLIIVDIQPEGRKKLEAEMIGGMLTAIRSFVSDCIARDGQVSELNEIDYGGSKIILEVGGYCYLAVLVNGEVPQYFLNKIRDALGNIIVKYGKSISNFEGDQNTIPPGVQKQLEKLLNIAEEKKKSDNHPPLALLGLIVALLGLIFIPLGIKQYQDHIHRNLITNVSQALINNPELSIYHLDVKVEDKTLELTGRLPNTRLRDLAGKVAAKAAPEWPINNQTVAVNIPPEPLLVAAEVKRVTKALNQMDGVKIRSEYEQGKVTVKGDVMEMKYTEKIVGAIERIPGVTSVVSSIKLNPIKINDRIYFAIGSTDLQPGYEKTITEIQQLLAQHPQMQLKIIGHSDQTGRPKTKEKIALKRAEVVRDALIEKGVSPQRLQVELSINSPEDIKDNQPPLLSRVVVFKLINN